MRVNVYAEEMFLIPWATQQVTIPVDPMGNERLVISFINCTSSRIRLRKTKRGYNLTLLRGGKHGNKKSS
jgi:hypothetical protein